MTRSILGLDRTVIYLASTHFVVDGYGNIYAPLLPLLIPQLGLTFTLVGVLQMCFQMSNSVAQLAFGRLADRWRPRLLLLVGPIVSVTVLSLIGLVPGVWPLAALLIVGGLGGAAFHPPAAALVHQLGGNRKGLAMSTHISGGSVGFALGPILFAPFVDRFGLAWTPVLMLPGLVALAMFLRHVPRMDLQTHHDQAGLASLRPYARPLSLLYAIVVLRTLASLSFATFMPVMLTGRGMSMTAAGSAVAVYLFASGVGGFLGGPAADRWGARLVIIVSLVASVPFLALAPALTGWTFIVALAIGGFLLQSTLPVNVTFGQTIAPVSAATVSSLMMGFAWGTGGLSVPLVGMLADRIGIERALITMAVMPLVAAGLALPLPSQKRPISAPRAAELVPEPTGTDVAD